MIYKRIFLNEKPKIVWDSVFVVKSLLLKSLHVFKSGFAFLICIASSVNSFFLVFRLSIISLKTILLKLEHYW